MTGWWHLPLPSTIRAAATDGDGGNTLKRYLLLLAVLAVLLGPASGPSQSKEKSEPQNAPTKSSTGGKAKSAPSQPAQKAPQVQKAPPSQPRGYQPPSPPRTQPQPPTRSAPPQTTPPTSRPQAWEAPKASPPPTAPRVDPPSQQPRSEPPVRSGDQVGNWEQRGYERPTSGNQGAGNSDITYRPGAAGQHRPPTQALEPRNADDEAPGLRFAPRTGGAPTQTNFNIAPRGQGSSGLQTPSVLPTPAGAARDAVPFQITPSGYRKGDLRVGYHHYDRNWCDRYFGYRYYCYDPWVTRCYFSPYYWYIFLPGYIWCDRVIIISPRIIIWLGPDIFWNYCGSYGYYYGSYGYTYNRGGYSDLDRALSDIVDAFRYEDANLLAPFLPSNGRIDIYIDGRYSYSVNSDDYYDMTADLIYSVNTTNFEIVQVRRARTGEYRAVARHDFLDPNGRPQTVWMTFTLERERYGFVIVEAGTSRLRPSF